MAKKHSDINKKKIKIGLLGCGRISRNHINAIALHHRRANLVAICDSNKSKINEAHLTIKEAFLGKENDMFNPKEFNNFQKLLDAIKNEEIFLDLLVIATPSGMHAEQSIAASKAGINVCTEKPMATSWEDGVNMTRAFDEKGLRLFVVKQNRLNKTLQLVKKQIDRGRFGKLSMISSNVFWQRPQDYYDQDAWRGTLKMDGGALMNQASHYVDLIDWLVGPVSKLSASVATIARNIEAEDTAAIQFTLKNGGLGTLAVTMLTYPKNLEGSITILGEKGTVKIGGKAVNKIEQWSFADKHQDDLNIDKVSQETTSVYGFGHSPYYENMLDVLEGKAEPLCDGKEGLKSLELLISAYKSANDNCVINLPLLKK